MIPLQVPALLVRVACSEGPGINNETSRQHAIDWAPTMKERGWFVIEGSEPVFRKRAAMPDRPR
jgi:hypothetical protein